MRRFKLHNLFLLSFCVEVKIGCLPVRYQPKSAVGESASNKAIRNRAYGVYETAWFELVECDYIYNVPGFMKCHRF
jgi:hypothetical protein